MTIIDCKDKFSQKKNLKTLVMGDFLEIMLKKDGDQNYQVTILIDNGFLKINGPNVTFYLTFD